MRNKPILIVAGEPYSVFIELFLKAVKRNKVKKKIILVVSQALFLKQMKRLNYNFKIKIINKNNIVFRKLNKNKINIVDVNFKYKKTFDKISDKSNYYIDECFKIALKLIKTNQFVGLINGPISKKNFLKTKSLGITEYLANKTNRKNKVSMLIYNKKLSVCPITTHLPVKDISKKINKKKIIYQVKLINNFFKKEFNIKPKIAITGLNPHCESNYKSSEENKIIKPAIKNLLKRNYDISGPFPADTIFMKQLSKKYDVIIGMYHDQVLTPAKTIFGFNSINITLGLPFIRISPDHGPNNAMLGKNISNPQSLIKALEFFDR